MIRSSIDRREFLRRAGLTAGTIGVAGGAATLPGCGGDDPTDPTPPLAPTGLIATVHSAARIDLAWSDNASDETAYEVERRVATDIEFVPLATLTSDQIGFTDESVVEQTMYVYRVRAVAGGLDSEYSNEAEATTPAAGAPLAPLALTVEVVESNGATIRWTDAAVNENGYRVERVDDVGVVTILTLPRGATSAVIEGLATDDVVRVRVVAFNEAGDSPPSGEVRFMTGAVADGIAIAAIEPGKLRVTWSDRTAGRLGFQLDRDAGPGFVPVATLPPATVSFDDTNLPLGVTAVYRVSAAGAMSIDPPTASMAIPAAPPEAPGAPLATLLPTDGSKIRLEWQHPGGDDLFGFTIERKIGTGQFTRLPAANDPSQRTLEDAPTAVLVAVVYRIFASNLAGTSSASTEVTITPRAVYFFNSSQNLMMLKTVNKGVAVTINRPAVSLGASCSATTTSVYLVRESETRMAAVVAHCTHQCLRPPNFRWIEDEHKFRCAHGSEFDLTGEVLQAPAARNVATLPTALFEDRVEVLPPAPRS